MRIEAYSGPLPHPELLAEYERILPGAADRILSMAERQQGHRHDLESTAMESNVQRSKQGLAAGFVICLAFLVVSAVLIGTGHEVAGTVLGSFDLLGLVSLFVIGQSEQTRERRLKREQQAEYQRRTEPRSN
jgi:uncharacterized membrane protein